MYSDVEIYREKYYEGLGEEMYAGQQALKFRAYANLEIAADPALMIQKQSDCLAWAYYDVMGWDYYGEVSVWMNEDGEYIGIELDEDALVRADVNGNGSVDSVDYLLVKRIVLGTYNVK